MAINPVDDWVQRYCAAPENAKIDVLSWILFKELFGKAQGMYAISQRLTVRVSGKAAICGIFNELDSRWRQFARRVAKTTGFEDINPDGFALFLQKRSPDIYSYWMQIRKEIKLPVYNLKQG